MGAEMARVLKTAGARLFMVAVMVLGGCTSIHKQIDMLPRQDAPVVESGVHFHDILDSFGCPGQVTSVPGGFAFLYESLRVEERQFGISLPGKLMKWFKMVFAKADTQRQIRVFLFDNNGLLDSHVFKSIHEDAGKGISVQFLVELGEIVDTRYLEATPGQNDWGFALLKPLPTTLNAAQSLDAGTHGLELRGTPTGAGQRSLELIDISSAGG